MGSASVTETLRRARTPLEAAFGGRLKGVVLYGSAARADAREDSDIDLMVLLTGPVDWGRDLSRIVQAIYPLQLELPGRPMHAIPVDSDMFRRGEHALYRNAQRDGIRL